ncbi:MAG: tRNA (adenosine(37)-N6)-threonylcarbamoyltransferase complex transferase subunit TsaD [Oscillospiraceae bacterium]|nr:tRNA (adenosine(37)-N6)-threonylcarbamoyltransferase complex transferase subunit TsaD [Oscillospiraceae bacterium]
MYILAIESSCDETAAAVSKDGREILSNVIATQIAEHRLYGGVVPEIASRRHTENINAVVKEAMEKSGLSLSDIDAIAVTYAPGLIGALLVGTSFAKGLSMATGKPLIPVHHIAGHIASNYIAHKDLKPPYLCLVASGGHSHIVEILDYTKFRVVGRTRDDAAGECFDKVGRVIGFPYPAGKFIDDAAKNGDANFYKLPKPVVNGSVYDFSFSGLKTAVINMAHNAEQKGETLHRDNMAASFQKTVAEILTEKTILAAKDLGYKTIALAGGVSANSGVRQKLSEECEKNGFSLYMPPLSLCGDNAAMIACQGYYDFLAGKRADESLNAIATLSLENI